VGDVLKFTEDAENHVFRPRDATVFEALETRRGPPACDRLPPRSRICGDAGVSAGGHETPAQDENEELSSRASRPLLLIRRRHSRDIRRWSDVGNAAG
jgi:hypothetical protein